VLRQRTLRNKISTTGVGLHSGVRVQVTLRPAPADTGIVFRRVDLRDASDIEARADAVVDTRLSTCVGAGSTRVATIEHLMSALAGLGIDNLYVDLSGPEVPILDGSAGPWVFLLQAAGVEEQRKRKRFLRIREPVRVAQGEKWACLEPFDGFRVDFTIDFPHPVLGAKNARVEIDFARQSYVREIARARTFGFMHDVEAMRAAGLALGGSLDNAVVLDEFRILNSDGLRYENELVRHKVLDAVGDLYLLGHPLIGGFVAFKSGHALNNELCRALLAQPRAWELVSFDQADELPAAYHDWQPQAV
jgi:UDP-3-O-[3-hydroxymyristoyl] N-acetylglucosamine deacetylase